MQFVLLLNKRFQLKMSMVLYVNFFYEEYFPIKPVNFYVRFYHHVPIRFCINY